MTTGVSEWWLISSILLACREMCVYQELLRSFSSIYSERGTGIRIRLHCLRVRIVKSQVIFERGRSFNCKESQNDAS